MNMRANTIARESEPAAPGRSEAVAALDLLRRLVAEDPAEAAALGLSALSGALGGGALSRAYPEGFEADEAYRATLPDLQNGPASLIKGRRAPIQHVGISNFRLPLHWATRSGEGVTLETSVTGSVSLDATKKGINMSRIMRSFYAGADRPFGFDAIGAILDSYATDIGGLDARLALRIRFPMLKNSLRSGLAGYQYYDATYEMARTEAETIRAIHLDYVYASTCPCSLELAEHARASRGQIATPHSQRSVARISALLDGEGERLWLEDLIGMCRAAIPTETQVMVKREDEQAFAELNGSNPIFVEDAARLLADVLSADARIGDFRVAASHQESLHSHDAISVLTEGDYFAGATLAPHLFDSLIHRG
ncbi:GTP cyclohydrolase FolE2 [Pikeienuella sp. HZG-20]|uniref:GTP cyclohydrolase FolE2 n=1 Tax=Paludibacillus litoralis TaxID=3133267 RepID=UPI0030EEDF77